VRSAAARPDPRAGGGAGGGRQRGWRCVGRLTTRHARGGGGHHRRPRRADADARPRVRGWNPSVAIASTADAVVAWSSLRRDPRSQPEHPTFRQFVAGALRRGSERFGRPQILAREDAARYVHAAVGDDGRAMVAWPSGAPTAVLRAAIAPPGAPRFAPATVVSPLPAPFDLALTAAPSGFVALWPILASHPESGWRLALAPPGARLLDSGRVSDPFLEGYGVDARDAAVFGDRRGNVTAV
jgi:hypothetical protein